MSGLSPLFLISSGSVISDEHGNLLSKEPSEIASSEWFSPLCKLIRKWYLNQYGSEALDSKDKSIKGFVLIRDTPFMLCVPSQLIRPSEQPRTIWLEFVDRVLAEEDPLAWVRQVPKETDDANRSEWRSAAEVTAADLRFIRLRTMFLPSSPNSEVLHLARTIIPHLEHAAGLVLTHQFGEVTRSYWELQMAVEAAFKVFLLQRNGLYPHTHDLTKLSNEIRKFEPSYSVPCLATFPDWKKAAEMRYGIGDTPSWKQSHRDYRCILMTVRACAKLWQTPVDLTNVKFLLKHFP